jgi:hypothetical protein
MPKPQTEKILAAEKKSDTCDPSISNQDISVKEGQQARPRIIPHTLRESVPNQRHTHV